MKIPNYSYRKVTCCKTNSWKSGGRHSCVFQVFPDISISLTHKQTPRQILILHDASKILDMTSWVSHHVRNNRRQSQRLWQHPGGQIPKAIEVLVGWRIKLRMYWRRRLQQESRIHIPRLFFSCSHEELFSRIVSIPTSIFMDCILCAWSCAKF